MLIDGGQVVTVPSGWTQIASNTRGSVARGFIMGKVADGTEDSTTVSVTIGSTSERGVIDAMAIQDWGGAITDVESSTTNNNSSNDDPPSLTPSWGLDDTLFLACRCADGGTMQSTAYPTNYTLGQSTQGAGGGGSGASGSVCGRQVAAATEDPGAFTNPSSPSSIYTVAVKPAAAGGGGGRIMSSLAYHGGLVGSGGIAGQGGGLAA